LARCWVFPCCNTIKLGSQGQHFLGSLESPFSCLVIAKRMAGRWYRSHSRRARESPSHRRRKVHSSTTCYSRPSSALLSILGTIAASSSNVNASPAPPPFLCPSFHTDHPPIAPFDPRHSRIPEKVSSYSPDPTDKLPAIARSIPDKYERGDDGKWRRVNEYTLYGSTVCLVCPLFT